MLFHRTIEQIASAIGHPGLGARVAGVTDRSRGIFAGALIQTDTRLPTLAACHVGAISSRASRAAAARHARYQTFPQVK